MAATLDLSEAGCAGIGLSDLPVLLLLRLMDAFKTASMLPMIGAVYIFAYSVLFFHVDQCDQE